MGKTHMVLYTSLHVASPYSQRLYHDQIDHVSGITIMATQALT